MQSVDELNEQFGLPGVLQFRESHPGMPSALITTPSCTAEFYLYGAHLTQWTPTGHEPALYLSPRSGFTPGKPIRGGIPLVFPWFGPAATSPIQTPEGAAQHGFARVSPWSLRFAAFAGEDLHLSAVLDQTEAVRALGFTGFELAIEIVLGRTLAVRLTAANTGEAPFHYEDVLHAYLHVGDSREVSVEGLEGTNYLDKTDDFKQKTQSEPALRFVGEVDRPYLNTVAPLAVVDPALRRRLRVEKKGSRTTVTWNPGEALAAKLPDLLLEEWNRFVCIEPGNVAGDLVTLQPREAHTTELRLSLESL